MIKAQKAAQTSQSSTWVNSIGTSPDVSWNCVKAVSFYFLKLATSRCSLPCFYTWSPLIFTGFILDTLLNPLIQPEIIFVYILVTRPSGIFCVQYAVSLTAWIQACELEWFKLFPVIVSLTNSLPAINCLCKFSTYGSSPALQTVYNVYRTTIFQKGDEKYLGSVICCFESLQEPTNQNPCRGILILLWSLNKYEVIFNFFLRQAPITDKSPHQGLALWGMEKSRKNKIKSFWGGRKISLQNGTSHSYGRKNMIYKEKKKSKESVKKDR